jgi:hypothetical protein
VQILRKLFVLTVIPSLVAASAVVGLAAGAQAAPPARPGTLADCPPLNAKPTPIGPSGTIASRFPLFKWTAVPGIDEYVLLVLYESDNEEYAIPGQPFTVTGTSFRASTALPTNVGLRWKVKTECDEQYGPFTDSVYFDVEPPCHPIPACGGLAPQDATRARIE